MRFFCSLISILSLVFSQTAGAFSESSSSNNVEEYHAIKEDHEIEEDHDFLYGILTVGTVIFFINFFKKQQELTPSQQEGPSQQEAPSQQRESFPRLNRIPSLASVISPSFFRPNRFLQGGFELGGGSDAGHIFASLPIGTQQQTLVQQRREGSSYFLTSEQVRSYLLQQPRREREEMYRTLASQGFLNVICFRLQNHPNSERVTRRMASIHIQLIPSTFFGTLPPVICCCIELSEQMFSSTSIPRRSSRVSYAALEDAEQEDSSTIVVNSEV